MYAKTCFTNISNLYFLHSFFSKNPWCSLEEFNKILLKVLSHEATIHVHVPATTSYDMYALTTRQNVARTFRPLVWHALATSRCGKSRAFPTGLPCGPSLRPQTLGKRIGEVASCNYVILSRGHVAATSALCDRDVHTRRTHARKELWDSYLVQVFQDGCTKWESVFPSQPRAFFLGRGPCSFISDPFLQLLERLLEKQ